MAAFWLMLILYCIFANKKRPLIRCAVWDGLRGQITANTPDKKSFKNLSHSTRFPRPAYRFRWSKDKTHLFTVQHSPQIYFQPIKNALLLAGRRPCYHNPKFYRRYPQLETGPLVGFEPTTSSLQARRSTNWAKTAAMQAYCIGGCGGYGTRTRDSGLWARRITNFSKPQCVLKSPTDLQKTAGQNCKPQNQWISTALRTPCPRYILTDSITKVNLLRHKNKRLPIHLPTGAYTPN